jgi:hypothetical protein
MQIVAAACLLLYVAVTTLAGARLVWAGRKPGRVPERLLGGGAMLIGTVGLPMSVASGFGGDATAVHVPLWVVSELVTQIGVVCLYAFVQQVFRPRVGWARQLVLAAAIVLPVGLAAASVGLVRATPGTLSVVATGPALLLCQLVYAGAFVWSALEGFSQHRDARKRMAIGLADPVVANRFLLFAIFGVAGAGIVLANAAAVVLERNIATSLVVVVPAGVLSLVAAAAMFLAILPPAWFLARVRAAATTP